jgi:hypothetical protein
MAERAERSRPGLSVEAFRAFYQGRPDEAARQARRRACTARLRPALQGRRVVQGDPAGAAIREERRLTGTSGELRIRELRREDKLSL